MAEDIQPDPSLIGGVPKPPLAFLPEPVKLFQTRARRFAFLAESNALRLISPSSRRSPNSRLAWR